MSAPTEREQRNLKELKAKHKAFREGIGIALTEPEKDRLKNLMVQRDLYELSLLGR